MLTQRALSSEERRVYKAATEALRQGTTLAAFSAAFFGPKGLLRRLWKTEADREALINTELYRWLQAQTAQLRRQEADAFSKEVEALSGRLTVVVAKSLHGALRSEAAQEGVSLSELIRLKLSLPYRKAVSLLSAPTMKGPELPAGWDAARVQRVLEYYERQTDDEAVAEDEAAWGAEAQGAGGKPIRRQQNAKPRRGR